MTRRSWVNLVFRIAVVAVIAFGFWSGKIALRGDKSGSSAQQHGIQ